MTHIWTRLVAVVAGTAAAPALATVSNTVPEPGIIELLAVGAVAGVIVWVRNRRK